MWVPDIQSINREIDYILGEYSENTTDLGKDMPEATGDRKRMGSYRGQTKRVDGCYPTEL